MNEQTLDVVNLLELEACAREKLPKMAFDYYASGAQDEITLRRNRTAFESLSLAYRVLVDVSCRQLESSVLGHRISMPVLVAPTAFHKLADPEGELATVRAAGRAGTVMILSTLSNTPIEDVVAASSGPVWFQLYVYRDRGATAALVERARAAGCSALVLTVDAPLIGRRERDVRNRFHLPAGLAIENMLAAGMGAVPREVADSGLAAYVSSLLDPSLCWKDVDWLRTVSGLPVLIKGVVRADDAVRAAEHGASGIVVSNHGGRQLDTAPATVEVLEEIALALDGQIEILLDGGVRRGTDVVKALALGASAVLIGRPILWGLALGGQAGVEEVLAMLRNELDLAMALCGCPTIGEIGRDLVLRRH